MGSGGRELDRVDEETKLERRLDRMLARATTPRGAAVVIATVSTSITVGAGILMTVADRENFPSIGSGLWWAVQTVTTVGYGASAPQRPRPACRRAGHAGRGRLPDGHHRRHHEHVRVTLAPRTASSGAIAPTEEQLQADRRAAQRIEAALTDRPPG